jgi:hypothetical protein
MKSVLRDRSCVGFVVNCAKGYKAFSESDEPIGMFENETAAAKAVYQHSDAARPHEGR